EDTTQVSVAGHGAGGDQRSDRGPGKRSILVKGLERAEMFGIRPARPGLLRVEAVEVRSCVAAEVQLAGMRQHPLDLADVSSRKRVSLAGGGIVGGNALVHVPPGVHATVRAQADRLD